MFFMRYALPWSSSLRQAGSESPLSPVTSGQSARWHYTRRFGMIMDVWLLSNRDHSITSVEHTHTMTTGIRVVRRPDTTLVIYGESRQNTYKLSQRSVLALEQHVGRAIEFVTEDELRTALTTMGLPSLALDAADRPLLPSDRAPAPGSTDATVVLPPGAVPPAGAARSDATRQSAPPQSGPPQSPVPPAAYPYTVQSAPARSSSTPPYDLPPGGASPAPGGPGRRAGLMVGLLAAALVLLIVLLAFRVLLSPGATPTPSLPPTPTLAPPTAIPGEPMVTARLDTPVLAGPGNQYPTVGSLLAGQSSQAIGASADGQWWVIRFPTAPDQQGWVPANTVQVQNTSGLPIVPPPPVPTATPSPTPTPTPTVMQPPIAVINGPTQGEVGKQLTFSARNSTAGEGATIVRYEWNFGDQSQANGVEIVKVYEQPGLFNVILTVVNSGNLASQVVQTVSITAPTATPAPVPPKAVINAPAQAQVDQVVPFDGSGSTATGPIAAYNWTFGDGGTAAGARAEHTYRNAGVFNVTLTVRDRSGSENTAAVQITIAAAPVTPTPTPASTPAATSVPAAPPINGTSWSLTYYDEGQTDLTPVLQDTPITALFDQNSRLTGSTGCNEYEANYGAGAEVLTISGVVATVRLCAEPPGIAEQESRYLDLLPLVRRYQLSANLLELFDGSGKKLLQYAPL